MKYVPINTNSQPVLLPRPAMHRKESQGKKGSIEDEALDNVEESKRCICLPLIHLEVVDGFLLPLSLPGLH
jgi:hypothetical protein